MLQEQSGFSLSEARLDVRKLRDDLANRHAGAFMSFEGWVRDHNDGREVLRLDYEAFDALAQKEGACIIDEALAKFEIDAAVCVHRTGRLTLGDVAVWVGVTAAHRDAGFQAARYIIDEVKTRLPVWKKEHYKNGEALWVDCQHHQGHHVSQFSEADYYQRQMILPEVGERGQQKLKNARVLVVGAGGLGSAVLPYLAGAGVGTIGICEPDSLEISNLHRQVLYATEDIGNSKAQLAAVRLRALNPQIEINTHGDALNVDNAHALIAEHDLILDCTDNFETRLVLSDAAVALQKPLMQASVYQYEGQLHLYRPEMGGCLRCQWPDLSTDQAVGSCVESGVLGPVVGVLGALQATEAIKLIVGLPTPLEQQVLMIDLLTYQTRLIQRGTHPRCPACSDTSAENLSLTTSPWEVIIERPEQLSDYVLVDVSEAREHTSLPNHACVNLPFSAFDLKQPDLDAEKRYLFYCAKGLRSAHLVWNLRQHGFENVFALTGGLRQQNLHALSERHDYVCR